jgi:hypothetical protein
VELVVDRDNAVDLRWSQVQQRLVLEQPGNRIVHPTVHAAVMHPAAVHASPLHTVSSHPVAVLPVTAPPACSVRLPTTALRHGDASR